MRNEPGKWLFIHGMLRWDCSGGTSHGLGSSEPYDDHHHRQGNLNPNHNDHSYQTWTDLVTRETWTTERKVQRLCRVLGGEGSRTTGTTPGGLIRMETTESAVRSTVDGNSMLRPTTMT